MPYSFAIGQSFHEAQRTIVRGVDLTPPCRYFATRDSAGYITLPTLDPGSSYIELQGIQDLNYSKTDKDNKFRLLGDGGWEDSRKTGAGWQGGITSFFMKDMEIPAGSDCPQFRGNYEEGFKLIEKARRNEDTEIYVEILLELGQANGNSGNWIYDYTGVNVSIQNLKPGINPENLTQVSFDLVGRGEVVTGLYDAGSTPIPFGSLQTGLLFTSPSTGGRRYAVVPADNADAVVVSANQTVTYTSDGSAALTNLALGQADGGGFRLENASSGVRVPATVTLGGVGTNVVTINPLADLAAGTIYRLTAVDGAIVQSVDANGVSSPTGVRRKLQGFSTTFRTA